MGTSMRTYLQEMEYALEGLLHLIYKDDEKKRSYEEEIIRIRQRYEHILNFYDPSYITPFDDDNFIEFQYMKFKAQEQAAIREIKEKLDDLDRKLQMKEMSIAALSTSILQIAKQGIILVCGNRKNCSRACKRTRYLRT